MKSLSLSIRSLILVLASCMLSAASSMAVAADKIRVGVFPVASSLPLFVARDQGFLKEQDIEIEVTRLIGGPAIVGAMIGNQIDATAALVTIEGINANLKKPGVVRYVALNNQNGHHPMEQFVLRKGLEIKSLADLKGKKIMSSPGPANMSMAKAALAKAGLKEGEYQLDQLDQTQHVGAITGGAFDAAYTLEPDASVMRKNKVATTFATGVIADTVFGDPNADAWAAGFAMTQTFIDKNPALAKRFATAWSKALDFIAKHETEARKSLLTNTFTPPDVVDVVPLPEFRMVSDFTDKDVADFQRFIDFATAAGVLPEKVDVKTALQRF